MTSFTHYSTHTGSRQDKFFKSTLQESTRLLLGLNCLEPGQVQTVHDHGDQDKFYAVLEGVGVFTLGNDEQEAGPGVVVWAPAGLPHGVRNDGVERLVLLMGIAPPP